MNSWKSTEFSACLPPLRMFIIGTGSARRADSAEIGVERQLRRLRRRARDRHRHAEHRVGAELAFVRRAVERDHQPVDFRLASGIVADHRRRDFLDDVGDRLAHALAAVARLVAVAQLDGFILSGRGAGGDGGDGDSPVVEPTLDAHGWIAPRVEDFERAFTVRYLGP